MSRIDPVVWQNLFDLETVPACPEGMRLAEVFLAACGRAVEDLNNGRAGENRAVFLCWYDEFIQHCEDCEKCNEI